MAIPLDHVAAQAGQVRFRAAMIRAGRALATAILTIFAALGWTAGAIWFAAVFCVFATREGFRASPAGRGTGAEAGK